MTQSRITTIEQLHDYLYAAMKLEHATIPPYLTAMYSLQQGGNPDAFRVLRVVVVEEMLHLTLVANVLNAIGGAPDLTQPGFVPTYPAYLPDGENDFQVDIQSFSKDAVATFLNIERPGHAPDERSQLRTRRRPHAQSLAVCPHDADMRFYSIGEFYAEIGRGLRSLHKRYATEGRELFTGDPSRQVAPEYFYSGGGELITVSDLDSAEAALRLIAEQGEGLGHGIYDYEGELAHYFRFQQLEIGRYYAAGDKADNPTGPELATDWHAVYPIAKNPKIADYPAGSALREAAREFNSDYARFLAFLTRAFNGQPELLLDAVTWMFRLRDGIAGLVRNPIPGGDGTHGAPTFEVDGAVSAEGEGPVEGVER